MIISQAPLENRILLDSNNTLVSVVSENGPGHYFRAFIYIDDQLFDTQGWSRTNDIQATKDLKKLYHAYFQNEPAPVIVNALVEEPGFVKKVNITVKEYRINDDVQVDELDIPTFFILYNQNPEPFIDLDKLIWLDVQPSITQAPKDALLLFPFYANTANDNLVATLTTDLDVELHTQTLTAQSGKKVYSYRLNLDTVSIPEGTLFVTVTITNGEESISKTIALMDIVNYGVKRLRFKNNFGHFMYAYIDGPLEVEHQTDPQDYETADGSERIFEIDETINFKLSTGSLLASEKPLARQLANATRVLMEFNQQWLELTNKTRKFKDFEDFEHLYITDLSFSLKGNRDVDNDALNPPAPTVGNLTVTGEEFTQFVIEKTAFTDTYSGTAQAKSIRFSELINGSIFRVQDGTSNNLILEQGSYTLDEIDYFTFRAPFGVTGSPIGTVLFQISDGYSWSNFGVMTVNISALENPPAFSMLLREQHVVFINESGVGTRTISPGIVPDDVELTFLWEILGSVTGATLVNDEEETVTINLDNASPSTFQLRVTATDEFDNSLSAITTIIATQSTAGLRIANVTQLNSEETVYDLEFTDIDPEEEVSILVELVQFRAGQYALANFEELGNEQILDAFQPSITMDFEELRSQNYTVKFYTNRSGLEGDLVVRVTLISTEVSIIDPENNFILLSAAAWPSSE
jgi:hypothetical protein